MAVTPVKFFHSGQPGAPVINQTAGSFLAMLDACLVNGFGLNTVDSVSISGGIATVTRALGHPFEVEMTASIAGATTSGGSINGEQLVLSRTSTSYTFAATGLPDQTATGTITHKMAPVGWTKPFANSGNVGVFAPSDPAANVWVLRVADTVGGASIVSVNVSAYDAMSDVNTGTRQWPSGGRSWPKHQGVLTGQNWLLVADSRFFYLYHPWTTTTHHKITRAFGDFISYKSVDPYSTLLSRSYDASNNVEQGDLWQVLQSPDTLSRDFTGIGSATNGQRLSFIWAYNVGTPALNNSGSNDTIHATYPNGPDNGLILNPLVLREDAATWHFRGQYPGAYYSPQRLGNNTTFPHMTKVVGTGPLAGRSLLAIASSSIGTGFLDITGPWR
jgi:hypothetical protein